MIAYLLFNLILSLIGANILCSQLIRTFFKVFFTAYARGILYESILQNFFGKAVQTHEILWASWDFNL
jgi:hypothetical protein